ncbi:MAG: hypothetical protein EB066_05265 [Betaproteobacteria bacterium]|nr:hypothetical protein [Betaproteobacteria bacterium]NBY34567.1 hypothetical protein [Betaproteobacteria bacterium]NDF05834.1 hypothetical protein [Betaproteobacteria bacterium]
MLQLYIDTLYNLRSKWPNAWAGLPVVLNACIHRLWPQGPPQSGSQAQTLLNAAKNMASHMEDVADASIYEPNYHNRLHTADALTAICLLMQSLKAQEFKLSDEWAAALLLAVSSHDVLHPGGANGFVQEFEQRSAHEMRDIAQGLNMDAVWTDRVSELILRTDPTLVAANHDLVKDRPFEMNLDWACVLINEADILASATSRYGPELGQALAQEWALKNHPLHQVVGTPQGRLQFLSSLRFSSPAAERFGMAHHVAEQITSLRKA